MGIVVKRHIPIAIMVVLTIILMGEYFLVVPDSVTAITSELKSFTTVIAAFAMGLGAFNIIQFHGKRVMDRSDDWMLSVWLILLMIVMIVLGIAYGTDSYWFNWLWSIFQRHGNQTVYSLIGWVAFYAIYMSIRIDSIETLYFTVIWLFSFMANAPIGPVLWNGLPVVQTWIKTVPNTAATRGFYIANSLSAIAIGFRTLVGRTRVGLE